MASISVTSSAQPVPAADPSLAANVPQPRARAASELHTSPPAPLIGPSASVTARTPDAAIAQALRVGGDTMERIRRLPAALTPVVGHDHVGSATLSAARHASGQVVEPATSARAITVLGRERPVTLHGLTQVAQVVEQAGTQREQQQASGFVSQVGDWMKRQRLVAATTVFGVAAALSAAETAPVSVDGPSRATVLATSSPFPDPASAPRHRPSDLLPPSARTQMAISETTMAMARMQTPGTDGSTWADVLKTPQVPFMERVQPKDGPVIQFSAATGGLVPLHAKEPTLIIGVGQDADGVGNLSLYRAKPGDGGLALSGTYQDPKTKKFTPTTVTYFSFSAEQEHVLQGALKQKGTSAESFVQQWSAKQAGPASTPQDRSEVAQFTAALSSVYENPRIQPAAQRGFTVQFR